MDLGHEPVRHTVSEVNPSLIESWCLKCGVFIAASSDVRKLQAAEDTHHCLRAARNRDQTPHPRSSTGSI